MGCTGCRSSYLGCFTGFGAWPPWRAEFQGRSWPCGLVIPTLQSQRADPRRRMGLVLVPCTMRPELGHLELGRACAGNGQGRSTRMARCPPATRPGCCDLHPRRPRASGVGARRDTAAGALPHNQRWLCAANRNAPVVISRPRAAPRGQAGSLSRPRALTTDMPASRAAHQESCLLRVIWHFTRPTEC